MNSTFYYLHALSPLHVGTNQGIGVIDMPIAREKATNLPFVPGSALKGVLRYQLKEDLKNDWEALFGPEKQGIDDATSFAGALTLGDAHLLCFPVRSLVGTFAWTTCPFILARYAREAKIFLKDFALEIPKLTDGQALVTKETKLVHEKKVILEDLDLAKQDGADGWAEHIATAIFADETWKTLFKERFVILPDDILDFLAETATEVQARIKINADRRVVEKGALWYEENLPIETLLYGVVAADRSRKEKHPLSAEDVLEKLPKNPIRLQLGGNATTGRGLINWIKRGN